MSKNKLTFHIACAEWRKKQGILQASIMGAEKVKNISAFENGRSTNIEILYQYIETAVREGSLDALMSSLSANIKESI